MAVHKKNFQSYESYLKMAESGKTDMPEDERSSNNKNEGNGESWDGGLKSRKQAVDVAWKGWDKGIKEIKIRSEKLIDKLSIRLKRTGFKYDVVGEYWDVGRYLSGDPECGVCSIEEKGKGHGRVLNIAVASSASCHNTTEQFFNRGASISAIIDVLETMGVRCELNCIFIETGSEETMYSKVLIKKATDMKDLSVLSFALCHPAWLRRIHFSIMEQYQDYIRRDVGVPGGYGHPGDIPEEEKKEMDIYIEKLSGGFNTEEESMEKIMEILKPYELFE